MRKKILTMSLLIGAAVVFSGCWPFPDYSKKAGEKIMEKAIESQTGGKVDINADNGNMSIKTDKGTMNASTGGSSLPSNFPSDIYVAPDANIFLSTSSAENNSLSLAYYSKTKVDEIYSTYKEKLATNGWIQNTAMEINSADTKMINFKKGNRNLSVTIGTSTDKEHPGETMVNLVAVEDKSSAGSTDPIPEADSNTESPF